MLGLGKHRCCHALQRSNNLHCDWYAQANGTRHLKGEGWTRPMAQARSRPCVVWISKQGG